MKLWVLSIEYRVEDKHYLASDDGYYDITHVLGIYSSVELAKESAQKVVTGHIAWCDEWEEMPGHHEMCNDTVGIIRPQPEYAPIYYDGDLVLSIECAPFEVDAPPKDEAIIADTA